MSLGFQLSSTFCSNLHISGLRCGRTTAFSEVQQFVFDRIADFGGSLKIIPVKAYIKYI